MDLKWRRGFDLRGGGVKASGRFGLVAKACEARALGLAPTGTGRGCLVVLAIGGVDARCCVFDLETGGLFGRWPGVSGLPIGGVLGLLT